MKLFRRMYVSPEFYRTVRAYYPNIDAKESYARLMCLLLFPAHVEQDTRVTIIGQRLVAEIEGKQIANGYSAIRFLNEYSQVTGHNFELVDHDYNCHKTRTVRDLNLIPEVEAAWRKELAHLSEERVNFVTGAPYNRDAQTKMHQEDYEEAMRVESLEEATMLVLSYLNNLPINPFRQVVDKFASEALTWAMEHLDEKRLDYAYTQLHHTLDQPKQLYRVSRRGRTMRLVPSNPGFARMHREMRQILTQVWKTYDLKSAQLAICAMLWGVPEVIAFLQSGKSIWRELFDALGVSDKDPLKRALYGIVFGEDPATVRKELDDEFGPGTGQAFLKHPLIAAMLRARQKQIELIKTAVGPEGQIGGAYSCFGKWIEVPMDPPFEGAKHLEPNYRSVLAQQAQAIEFKLLFPVFQLAMAPGAEFQVVLYQYDGISIKFRRPAVEKSLSRQIEDAVRKQAEALGVLTYLEAEEKWQG